MYGNLEDLTNLLDEDCRAIEHLFPPGDPVFYTTEPNTP